MKKLITSIALALCTMAAGAQGPQARTACGMLEGTYEAGIKVFRGVPFAQPPVGGGCAGRRRGRWSRGRA